MKATIGILMIMAATAHGQYSLSSMPEASQQNAAAAYAKQNNGASLSNVLARSGSAQIVMFNRVKCQPCGGRGQIITRNPSQITRGRGSNLSVERDFAGRVKRARSGHTGAKRTIAINLETLDAQSIRDQLAVFFSIPIIIRIVAQHYIQSKL